MPSRLISDTRNLSSLRRLISKREREIAMNALHPLRATRLLVGVALLAATAAALIASSTPGHGITCDDVRGLTRAEQNYWSKQLNLTSDQRRRIRAECYGPAAPARVVETNGDGLQPPINRQ
jgi:hypothetical protein